MRARPTQGGFEDEAAYRQLHLCCEGRRRDKRRARERHVRACALLLLLVRAVSSFLRNTSRNPSTVDRAVRGVVTVDVRNPTFVPRKLPRLNGVLARGGEGTRELGRALASSV